MGSCENPPTTSPRINVDGQALRDFCLRHGIRTLSVFGSAARGELSPTSDVDLLVEFDPGRTPGLIRLAAMELALAELFDGREVELRTYEDLSLYFRDEARAAAQPIYGAA